MDAQDSYELSSLSSSSSGGNVSLPATTVVLPGHQARVDAVGNLLIEPQA